MTDRAAGGLPLSSFGVSRPDRAASCPAQPTSCQPAAQPLRAPYEAPGESARDDASAAAAAWSLCAAALSGDGWMRVSRDGGRTYPKGAARRVTGRHPGEPATISVADPVAGSGRLLALDLDVGLATTVHGLSRVGAVERVARDAAEVAAVVQACGGRPIVDVSPVGGRHVYVPLAAPLPWTELRDLVWAMARRWPTIDRSPHNACAGQIRPPGSRHRTRGYQVLVTPLPEVQRALAQPAGPRVWNALLAELASELAAAAPTVSLDGELDDAGEPWVPRAGGRRPLSPAIADIARTGVTPPGYATPSEARQAVVTGAAAMGWRLADLTTLMAQPAGAGLTAMYARYRPATREQALRADWRKACAYLAREESVRHSDTREPLSHPPADGGCEENVASSVLPVMTGGGEGNPWGLPLQRKGSRLGQSPYQQIRTWWSGIVALEHARRWPGPRGITVRRVLRGLGAAAQMSGRMTIDWGVRSLAIASGLDHSTVADVLRQLRDEPDPVIVRLVDRRGTRADLYELRVPDCVREAATWRRWRAGRIDAIHPVMRRLGGPAALVWEQLGAEPARTSDIVRAAALSPTATSDALRLLAEHGLAERAHNGWRRGPADPDALARELGVDIEIAELLATYARERAQWAAWLTRDPNLPEPPAEPLWIDGTPLHPPPWLDDSDPRGPPADPSTPAAPDAATGIALLEHVLGAHVIDTHPT